MRLVVSHRSVAADRGGYGRVDSTVDDYCSDRGHDCGKQFSDQLFECMLLAITANPVKLITHKQEII